MTAGAIAHLAGEAPDGREPLLDLERVGALLDRHRVGWLLIAGCVANQDPLYDRFDAVVLLSAPVGVLLERVTDRANPFGSTSEDRAKIASALATYEPLLRAGSDHETVITAPIAKVVSALEQIRGRSPAAGATSVLARRAKHHSSRCFHRSGLRRHVRVAARARVIVWVTPGSTRLRSRMA